MADTSGIMVHNFSERLLDNMVHFHIMKMKDSLFVWMGKKAELSSLSIAMCTKYVSAYTPPPWNWELILVLNTDLKLNCKKSDFKAVYFVESFPYCVVICLTNTPVMVHTATNSPYNICYL